MPPIHVCANVVMEILSSLEIAASPMRVWGVLTDFAAYPAWQPFVRIDGENEPGADLRYTLRKNEKTRGWTVDATLVRSEPCTELVMTFGIRPVLWIEEFYRIDAVDGGSNVYHGFRCTGFMLRVPGRTVMEKRLMPLLSIPLKRLQQRLIQPKTTPVQSRPVPARRKGFRQPPKRR